MVRKLIFNAEVVKAKFAGIAIVALMHRKTINTKPIIDNVPIHCRIKECEYLPE
jgi:hypothetical protein